MLEIILLVLGIIVGAIIGWLIDSNRLKPKLMQAESDLRVAQSRNEDLSKLLSSKDDTTQKLKDTFGVLASQALRDNNKSFLELAQTSLGGFQTKAQGDLEQRKQAIENLVKPLKETITSLQTQIQNTEKERIGAYTTLKDQLTTLNKVNTELDTQTKSLVTALKTPQAKGEWGQVTLRKVVELAGMSSHCVFTEQVSIHQEEGGRKRPDMIVHLPNKREVIVDAKAVTDAYRDAVSSSNDNERVVFMQRHARNVRGRMKELSAKEYWAQFEKAPDFVILFLPAESFFQAALEYDKTLIEDGSANNVVIATPTTLIALLRAISSGWREIQLAQNALEIKNIGLELHKRIYKWIDDYVNKIGDALAKSVEVFNDGASSLESRVLPSARKMKELGIGAEKEVPSVKHIDIAPRKMEILQEELKSNVEL